MPGASIPEGVPGWTSRGAERWAALRPPGWSRPLWSALVALAAARAAAFLPTQDRRAARPAAAGRTGSGWAHGFCFWDSKKAGDEAAEHTQDPAARPPPPMPMPMRRTGTTSATRTRALVHGRPREVLIYGAPQAGAPGVLVAAVPGQSPAALRTGPLRLPRPGVLPQTDDPRTERIPRA